jgi:hypothetical protein
VGLRHEHTIVVVPGLWRRVVNKTAMQWPRRQWPRRRRCQCVPTSAGAPVSNVTRASRPVASPSAGAGGGAANKRPRFASARVAGPTPTSTRHASEGGTFLLSDAGARVPFDAQRCPCTDRSAGARHTRDGALAIACIPSVRVELELWRGGERPLGRALSQKAVVGISATSGSGRQSQSPRSRRRPLPACSARLSLGESRDR